MSTTAKKHKVSDFKLVPANGAASFVQPVKGKDPHPIKEQTFKALLLASIKALEYAKAQGTDLAIERAQRNHDYFYNQIDLDEGDAMSLFLIDVNEWDLE